MSTASTIEIPDTKTEDSNYSSSNSHGSGTDSALFKSKSATPGKPNTSENKATEDEPAPTPIVEGSAESECNVNVLSPPQRKSKRTGTLESNRNYKICPYVAENKVAPIVYFPDRFEPRKVNQPSGQVYKVQAFRLVEVGIRRVLFQIGKTVEDYGLVYCAFPIASVLMAIFTLLFFHSKVVMKSPMGSFVSLPDPTTTAKHNVGLRSLMSSTINFNSSNPVFDTLRRSTQAEFAFIISPRSTYDSVLDKSMLSLYSVMMEQARQLGPDTTKWSIMCRENCNATDLATQLLFNREVILKYPESILKSDAATKYNQSKLFIKNIIGDCTLDSDGIVQRAGSILGKTKLRENLNSRIYEVYESDFKNMVTNVTASPVGGDVDVYFWSLRQFLSDVHQAFSSIQCQIFASVALLFLFTITICLKGNSYSSRPFYGFQMAMVITSSIAAGYSIQLLVDPEFNPAAFPAMFIVSAIGVLHFFGFERTWSRYSMISLHPIEKSAFIASWDGPFMVIGLVSLIFACICTSFFIQTAYLSYVLVVTGISLTAMLMFATLFMTACLYRSGRKEAEGVKFYHWCRDGDKSFTNKFVPDFDELTSGILHDKLTDLKPQFTRKIGGFMASSSVRTGSAFFLACYLMFAVWGISNMTVTIREEDFVVTDSLSSSYMKEFRRSYADSENFLEIVFEEPLDYYDQQRRNDILSTLKWALDNHYASHVVSWLADFERFQQQTIYDINPETIVPVVNYVFLKNDAYKKYASDLMFDSYQTHIIKSRMYIELNQKGINERIAVVNSILQQARKMGLPITVKAPFLFSLHHDLQALQTVFVAYLITAALTTIACFVLFSNPALACTQLVGSAIANIAVVAGAVHLFVELNIVTLTTVLLGNLLITSIVIYFCYSYCNAGIKQNTTTLKVQYAFQCSFIPSIAACFVPLITFSPLLLLSIPVVDQVFKIFILIALAAQVTYLLFLPGIMIFFATTFTMCCSSLNRIVEESDCSVAEQSAQSIFFIPSATPGHHALGYHAHTMTSQRMLMAPPSEDVNTYSRYEAGGGSSVGVGAAVGGGGGRRRRHRHRSSSDTNNDTSCDVKSISSRRGTEIGGDVRSVTNSRHQTPNNERRTLNHHRRESDVVEEQIYEEPESPMMSGHRPPLPMRDFAPHPTSHPATSSSSSAPRPSYYPRDDYFRFGSSQNELDAASWRQYFLSTQRYPSQSVTNMHMYPTSSPMMSRRYI